MPFGAKLLFSPDPSLLPKLLGGRSSPVGLPEYGLLFGAKLFFSPKLLSPDGRPVYGLPFGVKLFLSDDPLVKLLLFSPSDRPPYGFLSDDEEGLLSCPDEASLPYLFFGSDLSELLDDFSRDPEKDFFALSPPFGALFDDLPD